MHFLVIAVLTSLSKCFLDGFFGTIFDFEIEEGDPDKFLGRVISHVDGLDGSLGYSSSFIDFTKL